MMTELELKIKNAIEEIDNCAYAYRIEPVVDGYFNVSTVKGGSEHMRAVKVTSEGIEVY